MASIKTQSSRTLARQIGWAWLATIGIGILATMLLGNGIDINLSADVVAVSEAMLEAELRLRALAYIALVIFMLDAFVGIGLYHLLKESGHLLAGTSLVAKLFAAGLGLIGAMFTMNSAEIASHPAYQALADSSQRMLLNGIQATSNYTSFHLSLVLSSSALAGFYWLFLRSGRISRLIAGWGLLASVFGGQRHCPARFHSSFGAQRHHPGLYGFKSDCIAVHQSLPVLQGRSDCCVMSR